jgi:hypothetical protein
MPEMAIHRFGETAPGIPEMPAIEQGCVGDVRHRRVRVAPEVLAIIVKPEDAPPCLGLIVEMLLSECA